MSSIFRTMSATVCLLSVLFAPTSLARFQNQDADEIDQEERLNSETYNDRKSYSFPIEWEQGWLTAPIGFRVSAGSLNIDKFYYVEQIKFAAEAEWGGQFSASQDREEDFLLRSRQAEVRLGWRIRSGLYGGMAGEGGYYKKHGDLGWYAGYGSPSGDHVEFAYYSVDHYYNEKEPGPNRYSRRPWTVTGSAKAIAANGRSFASGKISYDSPLIWEQDETRMTYRYRSTTANAIAVAETSPTTQAVLIMEGGSKAEGKSFDGTWSDKQLARWHYLVDLGMVISDEATGKRWQPGIAVVERKANYDYSLPDLPDLEREDKGLSPDSIRRELMPYVLARRPLGNAPDTSVIYGPIWSYTEITENNVLNYANEVKFQAALEVGWTRQVKVLLNTNWDIDNLTTDFPYREKSFRPWDGGNLQIQALF